MVLRVRPQIFDILIIGSGPAGLNAALTCARTRSTAIVFDNQQYRNEGVTHMHTVASRDHFNPREFGRIAREQVESRYDTIWFQTATITPCAQETGVCT
jgi:thioredoxin reductase